MLDQAAEVSEMSTTAERVERIEKEISGVASQYGVDSWQLRFLDNIKNWRGPLTENQEKTLSGIEKKVFEETDDG